MSEDVASMDENTLKNDAPKKVQSNSISKETMQFFEGRGSLLIIKQNTKISPTMLNIIRYKNIILLNNLEISIKSK